MRMHTYVHTHVHIVYTNKRMYERMYGICMYMKPSTVFFIFKLEHCLEHVYFELCQYVNSMSKEIK